MHILRKGVRLLNKSFNIRTNEWPRFLLIYLIYFVALTGMKWGEPVVEAAFLEQVGVDFLPWAFIINATFSIIASAIYTGFADRVDNTKLLIALFMFSGLGIIAGLVLLGWNLVIITYPLLFLILNVPLLDIFNVHWPIYVNGFYDTQSAKRIIPLLASGARVAGIVAGLTLPFLNRFFSPAGIIFIWLIMLVIAALTAWLMPYLLKEQTTEGDKAGYAGLSPVAPSTSYLNNIRAGFRYVYQSSFLRWLALAALLTFILLQLINYQALQILRNELQTTEDISNFIGRLNAIGNLIALPLQLFLLNRLIGRIGLGSTSLIFPTGTLAVSGALALVQNIPTAALGYVNRTTFRTTFRNPIDNLLYNAVPLRVKGRARAFIVGLIVPVGSLIGGLLLLVPIVPATWLLSALIGILAIAYLASAAMVRKQYSQALITMLEQEDFSFLFSQGDPSLVAADPATLNFLQKKLEESSSYEFTVFMAQLISQVGGSQAVPILEQAVKTAPEAETRTAMIDALVAADVRGKAVRQLYQDFLADSDGRVRQSALVGLERLAETDDEQFLSVALDRLSDPDIEVRVQVLAALARSASNFYDLTSAVAGLYQLLHDEEPHRRAQGVRILGQIDDRRAIRTLVDYLANPEDEVRLEAAVAVEKRAKDKMPDQVIGPLVEQIIPLLQDPVERVRQVTLNVLGNLGSHQSHQAVVNALTDASPQVRATAVEALVQLGKSVIPIVHHQLDSPDLQLRKMAAIVLSRISQRQFGGLVESQIIGNLLTIYSNYSRIEALASCARYPTVSILQGALREQNQELIDEIFYILATVHDPDAIEIITESLQSESSRVRANAAEALESLTSPQTAQLIAPLFEPDLAPVQLLSLSKEAWDMPDLDTVQAIEQIITTPGAPWLRAIMTFALGEMGVSLSPDGADTTAKVDRQKRGKARRSQPADLLGMFADAAEDTSSRLAKKRKTPDQPAPASQPVPLTLPEIEALLKNSAADPDTDVRLATQAARRLLSGFRITEAATEEVILLSTIEKIIFLKQVPFFKGMTINQLEVLAKICEQELLEEDQWIFHQGDPGGAMYIIVSGRVGIELEKRKGSYARLATLGAYSYFGEMSLFDNSTRSAGALTIQDTLLLRLRREPLIALARQYPDVSLELIKVLSERLRKANLRITELTRSRPRELQKLFDQFD